MLPLPAGVSPTIDCEVMAFGRLYTVPGATPFWKMPLTPEQTAAINEGQTAIVTKGDTDHWLLLNYRRGE